MVLDELGRPMKPVHVCWSDVEAAVVVSYLGAHGIRAEANSEVPHTVLPVRAGVLGKVRVLVRMDDLDEALALLAEAHLGNGNRHGDDSPEDKPGPACAYTT